MHALATSTFLAMLVVLSSRAVLGQEHPNIVFLLADDMGYADAACMGHPYAKTPEIDQLAREGTIFRTYYAAAPTCVPSRFGLITGRFPGSLGEQSVDSICLADGMTVPALLKKHGYATGHFGKWDLGPTHSISSIGLDELQELRGDPGDPRGRDAIIADAAVAFIQKNRSGPFFVNVWFHSPHHPIAPNSQYLDRFSEQVFTPEAFANSEFERYLDSYKSETGSLTEGFSNYLGDIAQLDEQIGRIVKCIEDSGLKDRTIVIFSSDNGPARIQFKTGLVQRRAGDKRKSRSQQSPANEHMLGYAGNLRGGKHSIYEGGIRTPLIIQWPGRVPKGRIDQSSIISAVDILPTLATIVGAPEESEHADGEDVSQMWLGNTTPRQRDLYWQSPSPLGPRLAVRRGRWKLCEHSNHKLELFDLETDPAEQINLADTNPTVVLELQDLLKKWEIDHPARTNITAERVLDEDSPQNNPSLSTFHRIAGRILAISAVLLLAVLIWSWWHRKQTLTDT